MEGYSLTLLLRKRPISLSGSRPSLPSGTFTLKSDTTKGFRVLLFSGLIADIMILSALSRNEPRQAFGS